MITKKAACEFITDITLKRYLNRVTVFVFLVIHFCFIKTLAQRSGDLDLTFNGTGFVTTSVNSETEQSSDLIVQPDGKIVVVGDARSGSNIDFIVIRYNADGTLDNTFDQDGIVITAIGSGNEEARSVALQTDGKIVVAGYSDNANRPSDFAVVRYNADGSLDTTFNGTGKIITPIGSSFDYAEDVVIQTDGKIVVAGRFSTGSNSNEDFAVVRYNSNGTLDTSFSQDGITTTAVSSGEETVGSVLLQSDGKIVVAGSANSSVASSFEFYDFAAVRYNPDGTLDASFDFDGMVITPVGSLADFGRDAQLQSDGKIVVTGLTQNADYNFGTIRYNADGSLDASFGSGGKVVTNLGGYESANSLVIQSDGKIVTGGSGNGFTLIRYNADGTLDNSLFGHNGVAAKPDGSARALAMQPDGKIVAAGIGSFDGTFDIRVARYMGVVALPTEKAVIKGRVLSPSGRPLPRVFVRMTKSNGNTQTVMANSFGYYYFENIEMGQKVTLKIVSNQFQFQPQTVEVDRHIINLISKADN